jgi:hypothetical protein
MTYLKRVRIRMRESHQGRKKPSGANKTRGSLTLVFIDQYIIIITLFF